MTDIKARLDEIAKEVAYEFTGDHDSSSDLAFVRAAINKALEVALTAEPSEGMIKAAQRSGLDTYEVDIVDGYRAMSSALLEEIKNETPRP